MYVQSFTEIWSMNVCRYKWDIFLNEDEMLLRFSFEDHIFLNDKKRDL